MTETHGTGNGWASGNGTATGNGAAAVGGAGAVGPGNGNGHAIPVDASGSMPPPAPAAPRPAVAYPPVPARPPASAVMAPSAFVAEAMDFADRWYALRGDGGVDPFDRDALFRAHLVAADAIAELARRRWPGRAGTLQSLEDVARGALAVSAERHDGQRPFLPSAAPTIAGAVERAVSHSDLLPVVRVDTQPAVWRGRGPVVDVESGRRRRGFFRPGVVVGIVLTLCVALTAALLIAGYWREGAIRSERARGQVSFTRGQLTSVLSLTSGAGRPRIMSFDTPLVEFSAWDSTLIVDGEPRSLWDHHFNYSVDLEAGRAAVTIEADDGSYQLEQLIRIRDDRVELEWYFIALEPVQVVELEIGHFDWYWVDAWREGDTVVVLATELDREALEAGIRPEQAKRVEVTLGDAARVRAGYAGRDLVNFFSSTYRLKEPTIRDRVLIASETVRVAGTVDIGPHGGADLPSGAGGTRSERAALQPSYGKPDRVEPAPFVAQGSGFHG